MPEIRDVLAMGAASPTTGPDFEAAARRRARRTRRRRAMTATGVLAVIAVLGVTVSALAGGDGGDPGSPPAASDETPAVQAQFASALQPFDACETVLDYLQGEAADQVGAYGLPGDSGVVAPPLWREDRGLESADESASQPGPLPTTPPTTIAARGAPDLPGGDPGQLTPYGDGNSEYSTSNVQEVGVDEVDAVKTDGEIIVLIRGDELFVVDVTGDGPRLANTVLLPQNVSNPRLFLDGGRVLVVADGGVSSVRPYVVEPGDPAGTATPGGRLTSYYGPTGAETPSTVISEIDVSDPDDISLITTKNVEGRFVAARMIDGVARVVISTDPAGFDFVYPSTPDAEAAAETANQAIVASSALEDWIPDVATQVGTDDPVVEPLLACDSLSRPSAFSGFGVLSVLTIDLADPLDDTQAVGVFADAEIAYASEESLYVATNRFVDPAVLEPDADPEQRREFEQEYTTELHKFDLTGPGPAAYVMSGSVAGHVLNQFSLSEYEGRLRVATTDGPPWGRSAATESFVAILEESGDGLAEIGRVGDLGKGEQIYSVRFVEDTAYVVTFRQTDPLYVVDLSDPVNPVVAGELDLLGFSSYLHPLGGDRLIGIGQDATGSGVTTGVQVSLFDVSDPGDPTRISQWSVPGGTSLAEEDQLAFLWWAPEELAVLPVRGGDGFTGAVALTVSDQEISERARIVHNSYLGDLAIDRSLVIGGQLYTISTDLLVASDLDTLTEQGRILLD